MQTDSEKRTAAICEKYLQNVKSVTIQLYTHQYDKYINRLEEAIRDAHELVSTVDHLVIDCGRLDDYAGVKEYLCMDIKK